MGLGLAIRGFEVVGIADGLVNALLVREPEGDTRSGRIDQRPYTAFAASRNDVLAIGEIGLDYHYNLSTPAAQQDVFRRQIRLARELELPVIVHHRDAEADLARILKEEHAAEVRGILHSFTASLETAQAAIDHGFLISFSGILTFKNAQALQDVARALPLDNILVETDCPYLAPVPHRGKRNEPVFVKETAAFLARLKGVSEASVEAATDANFQKFFGI